MAALAAALDAGMTPPALVVLLPRPASDPPAAVRAVADQVLTAMRGWISDQRLASSRLMVTTQGGVAVTDAETADLAQAPVWGLVRSAQEENPDRFLLVDVDGSEAAASMLPVVAAWRRPRPRYEAGRSG